MVRSRHLAGALAIGLALTACSSSGGHPGTPTQPTTQATAPSSPAATTTPPAPSSPASSSSTTGTVPSHDTLAGIVVQQSEVPGYTAQPATPDNDTTQQQVVACVGSTSVDPADKVEKVQSDDFVHGQVTVSSDATSYKSQAAVAALTAVIQSPKAQTCLEQSLKQQLEAGGTTVDSVSVQVGPGGTGAPSNLVALLKGSVTITAQGQQATLYVAQAFIVGRQLTATVSAQSINARLHLNKLAAQTVVPVITRAAAA